MNTFFENTINTLNRFQKLFIFLFFTLFFLLGVGIYKHYGFSWDEHLGRQNGVINAIYMAHTLAPSMLENKNYCPDCPLLTEYMDADHGPIFEIATTFLEWVFNLKEHRQIFLLRHFSSFFLFFLSSIFFFKLLNKRFRNIWLSMAGVAMLIASPRIFGDAFFNAKDIPFLAMTIICSFTMQNFLQKKNLAAAAWHALVCGLTIDIRILGLLFPVITVTLLLLDLGRKGEISVKRTALIILVYLILTAGFIIMFWPYLWSKPLVRFPEILARSSSYPWNGLVLYLGELNSALKLPWHYLPVWIFITTPVLYTILCLTGCFFILKQLLKNKFRFYSNKEEQFDLAMAGIIIAPIAATIILKLVLYDGWRHMFFLYAGLIYLAVLGFYQLYCWFSNNFSYTTRGYLRKGLIAIWAISVLKVITWMIINHPHQNVYFSVLNGEDIRQQFELDYWGLSYRQGLLFVLEDSNKPEIKVHVAQLPGYLNSLLLTPEQRKRLVYVDHLSEAEYFLTEYRWHPTDYPLEKEVHQIKVDDIKIFSVFKLDRTYKELKTHLY